MGKPTDRPVWAVKEYTEINFEDDFISGNTIDMDINAVPISQVTYATSHAATMEVLRVEIESQTSVLSATIEGTNTIRIFPISEARNIITALVLAGGASQPIGVISGDVIDNVLTDATSGQDNVVEPDKTQKESAYNFKQYPPRQYLNWIMRNLYKWADWSNRRVLDMEEGFIAAELKASEFSAQRYINFPYVKIGNLVHLQLQGSALTTNGAGAKYIYPTNGKFPNWLTNGQVPRTFAQKAVFELISGAVVGVGSVSFGGADDTKMPFAFNGSGSFADAQAFSFVSQWITFRLFE